MTYKSVEQACNISFLCTGPVLRNAMANDATTTSEVIDALNETLDTVEAETSDLAGGVRAVVPDEEVGRAFGLMRRSGFDFESKRDPSSDNVVFNIEADQSRSGLGELFR